MQRMQPFIYLNLYIYTSSYLQMHGCSSEQAVLEDDMLLNTNAAPPYSEVVYSEQAGGYSAESTTA